MPTYVFKCPSHREEFTVKLGVNDPKVGYCPRFGCGYVGKRVYTAPGISFKGSGFYVNDYGKKDMPGD